jgi:hypothetical protein
LKKVRFRKTALSILEKCRVSRLTLFTALILGQRAFRNPENIKEHHANLSRTILWTPEALFIASLVVADKTTHDNCYKNAMWVQICSNILDVNYINQLERHFLLYLDYRLHVSLQSYDKLLIDICYGANNENMARKPGNHKLLKDGKSTSLYRKSLLVGFCWISFLLHMYYDHKETEGFEFISKSTQLLNPFVITFTLIKGVLSSMRD